MECCQQWVIAGSKGSGDLNRIQTLNKIHSQRDKSHSDTRALGQGHIGYHTSGGTANSLMKRLHPDHSSIVPWPQWQSAVIQTAPIRDPHTLASVTCRPGDPCGPRHRPRHPADLPSAAPRHPCPLPGPYHLGRSPRPPLRSLCPFSGSVPSSLPRPLWSVISAGLRDLLF